MHTLSLSLFVAGLIGAAPPEPDMVGPLVAALHDPDVEVRAYSAAALASVGQSAVEPLMNLIVDEDRIARAGAAYALGQLGVVAGPAKPLLIEALKDDDRDVRRQAAYAISRLLAAERDQQPSVSPPPPPPPVFPVVGTAK